MWNPDHIAELAAGALSARAATLAAEQAVKGVDALSETAIHPLLTEGFAQGGLGVFREQPYPGEPDRRPRHAERERCDLVLTLRPGEPLIDPLARLKSLDAAVGTLFESAAPAIIARASGIEPVEAFWLEVKVVGQFCYTHGIPGPNRAYSSELLRIAASDIPKLAKESRIRWAGVLLVLFTQDDEVARHDLGAFVDRCARRGLPIQSPSIAEFTIPDLVGNGRCTIAVVPVRPE